MPLTLTSVSFTYPAQEKAVLERLTLTLEKGWVGIVGAHKSGKTTLLNVISGKLTPTSGVVKPPGKVVYCGQSTDRPPVGLPRLLAHRDGPSAELFGRLSLATDWLERWDSLSYGERKRAQIACALLEAPEVLELDEPTTHADAATRDLLAGALSRYRGIGLLVSHDRDLLDRLCRACIMFEQGGITLRPGTYTQAREQANRELDTRHRQQGNAARQHAALNAEMAKRRDAASSANDKRSKRDLDKHDSDGRFRLNLARRSGKDGQAGKLLKQLEGRLHQAESRVAELFVAKRPTLSPDVAGVPSINPVLLHADAQELQVGERVLKLPAIEIGRQDRIGICGPHGSAKSALIRHLLEHVALAPQAVLCLPQEIEPSWTAIALPEDQLDVVRGALACLGADPDRVLGSGQPTPAEARQLMLAVGLIRKPSLIVLDEPTAQLDLTAIEAMEDCLAQIRCALVVVSQDPVFLRRLCRTRWEIAGGPDELVMSVSSPPAA